MIKLNLTHEFNSQDIRDYAAPGLIYKAHSHWPFSTRESIVVFEEDDRDINLALVVLNNVLISIDFDGTVYPVSLEWLHEYRQSIEDQNPGMADTYLCDVTKSIINYLYRTLDDRLKNSNRPSLVSENGDGLKKETSPAKV